MELMWDDKGHGFYGQEWEDPTFDAVWRRMQRETYQPDHDAMLPPASSRSTAFSISAPTFSMSGSQ